MVLQSEFITVFVSHPPQYHLHWKPPNKSRKKANLSRLVSHAFWDAASRFKPNFARQQAARLSKPVYRNSCVILSTPPRVCMLTEDISFLRVLAYNSALGAVFFGVDVLYKLTFYLFTY